MFESVRKVEMAHNDTCSTILWRRTWSRSRILMAKNPPFWTCLANLTLAKLPSPRVLPNSYFPTRVLVAGCAFLLILNSKIRQRQMENVMEEMNKKMVERHEWCRMGLVLGRGSGSSMFWVHLCFLLSYHRVFCVASGLWKWFEITNLPIL